MDRIQSLKIIKNTFENKFEKEVFIKFIIELLNLKSEVISDSGIAFNLTTIPNTYKPYIDSFEKVTSYHQNGSILDILIIRLQKHTSIERARTMQRNFIAWYLKGGCDGDAKDAALAAFVSPDEKDWRFSLIKMDYSVTEDKKGAAKLIEQFSPAKRWSFLVGSNEKSHTAQAQLIEIISRDDQDIRISELEEAFSVEKVTKEFFTKYRELFFKTKDALDEIVDKDIKVKSDFESKNISTVDFAKKLLGQIVFLYFLQKKGWFGVLRDADWGTGSKNFIRELFNGKHCNYNNFFNDILEPLFYEALRYDRSHDDGYYSKFNCKIPFLNGGLFDPIGDYDWSKTDIKLPNNLFSNTEPMNEGDIGTGILDIFDRYNFTVQEDEPLEKEVAVDPEMLGKVFENLLEVKDRKSKGTYYTPREIVHYMCQQSLSNYLFTELEGKIEKDEIEFLIQYSGNIGENLDDVKKLKLDIPSEISENALQIVKKLEDIKVCDPAVGSGAFLVGMMSEIIRTINVLSKYKSGPYKSIYGLKRDCIENSLYGVDIDKGAVEIAKLRLWLSLVVDEDDIKKIKPLPNLDYKIVCGNSLQKVEVNLFNQNAFNQLEKIKPIYFNETNLNKKRDYKKQIDELITEVTNGYKEFDFEVYFSEIFHKKNGFNIVIANPPYGIVFDKTFKKLYEKYFPSFKRNNDIYIAFYEKGLQLVKESGFLTYISPNTFLNGDYFKDFRSSLVLNTEIIMITDYKGLSIFADPTVFVCIFICEKVKNPSLPYNYIYKIADTSIKQREEHKVTVKNLSSCKFKPTNLILDKIYSHKNISIIDDLFLVKDVGFNYWTVGKGKKRDGNSIGNRIFYRGIQLNQNDIPFLKGRDIERYRYTKPNNFLKYDYKKYLNNNDIFRYSQNFFEFTPKIIYRQTSSNIIATIDYDSLFLDKTVHLIIPKNNNIEVDLLFLLALLNSKFINYIYFYISQETKGRVFSQVKTTYIKQIPIRICHKDNQKIFIEIVNKILKIKKDEDYLMSLSKQKTVKQYENQIDLMVYKLYDLSVDEIEIVENFN